MQKINLTTSDNLNISANYWPGDKNTALLLHMMPAVKESWLPLAELLSAEGRTVLAIDFRGHGQSEGGDYKEFSNEQHQAYYIDALAAIEFLQKEHADLDLQVVGASIGANITIKLMANDHKIAKGVALSAGTDYYGVRAIDDIKDLSAEQNLLLVAAKDDIRKSGVNCVDTLNQLHSAQPNAETEIYEEGGHGTDIWDAKPELIDRIINFLKHKE